MCVWEYENVGTSVVYEYFIVCVDGNGVTISFFCEGMKGNRFQYNFNRKLFWNFI